MQNNSTGMLFTNVPLGVVPNAPRWPSWKIHTSAPNAAVNESTLHASAFTGSTTLPVSRNSSTNVMAAISPNTSGSRSVTASTLSRLTCATPPISADRPAGPATSCNRLSWVSEACENSGAVLVTVRNALPSANPVAAAGGPIGFPPTNVPLGADTADTSGTRDKSAAYFSRSAGLKPRASGTTIGTAVAESCAKPLRKSSPTWCDDAERGSTRSSGKPHFTEKNGSPSSTSSAMTARPIGNQRRITNLLDRYQNNCSTGLCTGSGRLSTRRTSRRTSSASSREPSSTIAAGGITMEAVATKATVATPA